MKKILPLFAFCFLLFALSETFGFTSSDVDNADFLADQGIIVKQANGTNYRLDDTITRAEAIGIALKIKGVTLPDNYICKNYFTDAPYNPINNWVCRAVELARDSNLVSGENIKARPGDPITRSEVLAMIMYAALNNTLSIVPKGYKFSADTVEWQQNIFYAAEDLIMVTGTKYDYSRRPISVNYFPNRNATRAEVFDFARKIFENTEANLSLENGEGLSKILYLIKGDNKVEVDRGYIESATIINGLLIYYINYGAVFDGEKMITIALDAGAEMKIVEVSNGGEVGKVFLGKISSDNQYVYACINPGFAWGSFKVFSISQKKMIFDTTISKDFGVDKCVDNFAQNKTITFIGTDFSNNIDGVKRTYTYSFLTNSMTQK